jgi:hypothetical protein
MNAGIKDLIHRSRPIGLEGVRTLRELTATGYSFPSGHTQSFATFAFLMIKKVKKKWFTALTILFIILIGFSRIYLGVHWPSDVFGGIIIAAIAVIIGEKLFEGEVNKPIIVILLIGLNGLMTFFQSKEYVTITGIFTAAIFGIMIEEKWIKYQTQKNRGKNIIKFIIGIAILLAVKEGLKLVLTSNMFGEYVRYAAIGLWVTMGAPFLFKKMNL